MQSGKKNIIIPRYENTDIFLPPMDDTEKEILSVKENWLLETLSNLSVFTSDNESNKIMQVVNFNTANKRVEALDGYRIGMRTLEKQTVKNDMENIMLHRKCVSVFKKILDKKSDMEIVIYQDQKYIRVEGKDFTYIIRRVEGKYFDVERILTKDDQYSFKVNKEEIFSVMKYDCELVKGQRKPVLLHSEDGFLYTYLRTNRYEALDTVEVKENTMENDFYIGFNPQYLLDVFGIVDIENPVCSGNNNKSPIMVYGNEYSFLVLPVNINDEADYMKKCIDRGKVA